jgi:hypothetical protein
LLTTFELSKSERESFGQIGDRERLAKSAAGAIGELSVSTQRGETL